MKDIAAATTPQTVDYRLNGLKPGLTYRYALKATNSRGTKTGNCVKFTTLAAQSVTPRSALLVGKANPNKQLDIRIKFVHSGSGSGYFEPTSAQSLYPYQGLQSVTKIVTRLNPGTRYGYCAVG